MCKPSADQVVDPLPRVVTDFFGMAFERVQNSTVGDYDDPSTVVSTSEFS